MKAIIKLFKSVIIKDPTKISEVSADLLEKTITHGFVLSSEVVGNFSPQELERIIKIARNEFGLSGEQMNASFHKSWSKIKDASILQLVMEQVIHYFSTYGMKALEKYSPGNVFIPSEILNIPSLGKTEFRLIIIKGITKEEAKIKLMKLLTSGIALQEDTIEDVMDVISQIHVEDSELQNVKNTQVRIRLHDELGIMPGNPSEFLMLLLYKATGKTMLIKDKATIEAIQENNKDSRLTRLLRKYKEMYGFEELATIFNRYKKLFLAFRGREKMNKYINLISKLSKTHHVPMEEDYLNSITAKLQEGEAIDFQKLRDELKKVNTFRKIRLAYALKYRTNEKLSSILYKIRNGKSFATKFTFKNKAGAEETLKTVLKSIITDVSRNVKGKRVFVNKYLELALPSSEKMFTGMVPSGSFVRVPTDIIIGVNWKISADLDLSLMDASGNKTGWDGMYRTVEGNILFSGDVTEVRDHENGASELFYIQKQETDFFMVNINHYSSTYSEIPFSLFVASEKIHDIHENYMVDPNNMIVNVRTSINKDGKEKILGLLVTEPEEARFYFCETILGNQITSRNSKYKQYVINYLRDFYTNTMSFNDILDKAGAIFVDDPEECEIDLSLEALEKDTIINLFMKVNT